MKPKEISSPHCFQFIALKIQRVYRTGTEIQGWQVRESDLETGHIDGTVRLIRAFASLDGN